MKHSSPAEAMLLPMAILVKFDIPAQRRVGIVRTESPKVNEVICLLMLLKGLEILLGSLTFQIIEEIFVQSEKAG